MLWICGRKSRVAMTSFIQTKECHWLWLGLPTVPYFPGRPVFRGLCPESRLGSSRDAKCPVFSWSQGQKFWCDATPIHIKFHPETLKLMCMGREHLIIWRWVSVTIWSVKSELSSLKKLLPECTITRYFKIEIRKIFWGGAQPLPRPRRLARRAFGAPHLALSFGFMRLVFSVPIVGNPNCD